MRVYIVPFMAIGRRTTLVVDLRFRGVSRHEDARIIDYEHNWTVSPFEGVEEAVAGWAAVMLEACRQARDNDFSLAGSDYEAFPSLISDLEEIVQRNSYGLEERSVNVGKFLRLLSRLNPATN